MNKQTALNKIKELEELLKELEKEEFVKIDYSVIPKEVFDKYGAKPFEVAKLKARKEDGSVWNNISFADAKKELEKTGCRLMTIQEVMVLLHEYRKKYPDNASINHKEFLGIEELSYSEDVCYEFINSLSDVPFIRGGDWSDGSNAGAFTLNLVWGTGHTSRDVGFRCAR